MSLFKGNLEAVLGLSQYVDSAWSAFVSEPLPVEIGLLPESSYNNSFAFDAALAMSHLYERPELYGRRPWLTAMVNDAKRRQRLATPILREFGVLAKQAQGLNARLANPSTNTLRRYEECLRHDMKAKICAADVVEDSQLLTRHLTALFREYHFIEWRDGEIRSLSDVVRIFLRLRELGLEIKALKRRSVSIRRDYC
jgi:hypothetical protein